jgi:hypothetical protein
MKSQPPSDDSLRNSQIARPIRTEKRPSSHRCRRPRLRNGAHINLTARMRHRQNLQVNSLVANGIDFSGSNCARVSRKELGLAAALDTLDKHKAEMTSESRVGSREGARTI